REPGLPLPGNAPRFLPAGEERIFREIRTLPATDPRTGKRVFRSGVGISTMSAADARQIDEEQARRALEDLLAGRSGALDGYAYLANRRAEALVDVLRGPAGESARITVNAYGSIVMNATAALFADVDTEDLGPEPRAEPARAIARADLQRHVDRTWKYATARFVERVGPDQTLPELRDLVEYHDRWTQAMSTKPLA